jgi:hypothetical protein
VWVAWARVVWMCRMLCPPLPAHASPSPEYQAALSDLKSRVVALREDIHDVSPGEPLPEPLSSGLGPGMEGGDPSHHRASLPHPVPPTPLFHHSLQLGASRSMAIDVNAPWTNDPANLLVTCAVGACR